MSQKRSTRWLCLFEPNVRHEEDRGGGGERPISRHSRYPHVCRSALTPALQIKQPTVSSVRKRRAYCHLAGDISARAKGLGLAWVVSLTNLRREAAHQRDRVKLVGFHRLRLDWHDAGRARSQWRPRGLGNPPHKSRATAPWSQQRGRR